MDDGYAEKRWFRIWCPFCLNSWYNFEWIPSSVWGSVTSSIEWLHSVKLSTRVSLQIQIVFHLNCISANSINQPCFRHCARHLTGETSFNSHSMMYMVLSVFYRLGNKSLEKLGDLHKVVQLVINRVFDLKSGLSDSKYFYFHLPLS